MSVTYERLAAYLDAVADKTDGTEGRQCRATAETLRAIGPGEVEASAIRVPVFPLLDRAGGGGPEARAEEFGVGVRTLYRWQADGTLPVNSARDVCDRLGLEPGDVWPDLFPTAA